MPRIVSLIASATEIACALGFEDHLVGRSHECDYPPTVKRLPVCTSPKFDVHGSSRDIDERVKNLLRDATSVYRVHEDILKQLRPEVILTQTQCDVCAVSLKDVEEALFGWMESRPKLVSLAPNDLADIWADIERVADALNCSSRGKALVAGLQARMAPITDRAAKAQPKPKVACLEWLDPLMAAGNWIPELVAMAGGVDVFGKAGQHSPSLSWQNIVENDPDIIIAMPCGYHLDKTRTEMVALSANPNWNRLQAARAGRVFITDGNQFFNRPGPRIVESLEILTELLHPASFHFGHQNHGWSNYSGSP